MSRIVYTCAFALVAQQRLDYRRQMAKALGLKFLSVKREHDVLDLTGKCQMTSIESFEVYELHLSHIDRRLQVPSATHRAVPQINVDEGLLPDGCSHTITHRDEGDSRIYTLNFCPSLHQTAVPAKFTIAEEVDHAIYMYEQDAPVDKIFHSQIESISQFVLEPIDILELSVTFPSNYVVGGQSQISVRYGRTETVHNIETERLLRENAVSAELQNGRRTLRLRVQQPIIGLIYYLYWQPPRHPKKTA